ncbi:MAG: NAD(P)/FAD-dependent oxidoreductase [Clostridia bacterium]
MNSNYDIIVVGAGTAGTYFAKRMASEGYSVLVIDKTIQQDLGNRLNVFHIDEELFSRFDVPKPQPGDEEYVTLFKYGLARSPFNRYDKRTDYPFLVMKLPAFLKRLTSWATSFGVEYSFETEFVDFIYANGKICGVKINKNGVRLEIMCRLVADCSGIPSVARRKLPLNYGVENFEISSRDKFYVVLRYVTLTNPEKDKINTSIGFPYYKTWMAPSLEANGAIFGVGANLSYEFAEKCYQQFEKDIKLPSHTLDHIEKGSTPYRRPPYSFVADGFITLGDSACITKPFSGEGITAAWVLCDIAAKAITPVMANNKYPTREAMWRVNVEYNRTQGADFAELMTTLIGAVDCTREEMDYEFKKSIVFEEAIMTRMNRKFANVMTIGEMFSIVFRVLGGLFSLNIRFKTVMDLIKTILDAGKFKKLYRKFPENPQQFSEWTKKVDHMWKKVGTMADKCKI